METTIKMDEELMNRVATALFKPNAVQVSVLRSYKYVVALDIGGGNCSAAILKNEKEGYGMPKLLRMSVRGGTSVWSNIGYDEIPGESGRISIGKQAQNRKYKYSNYKTVPTDLGLDTEVMPDNYVLTGNFEKDRKLCRRVEDLTRDFIRVMFEEILSNHENQELKATDRNKILIVVGHPSSDDWADETAHANLVRIVKEATGVGMVLTTAESNAAILYALNKRALLGGANKILIIDLGAYSADATYIDKERLTHNYFSVPLGGKAIDKNLAEIVWKNSGISPERLSMDYNMLYEARMIKELHWPTGKEAQSIYISLNDSAEGLTIAVSPEDFKKAVSERPASVDGGDPRSYTECLRDFITAAKDAGVKEVDFVLVTGGAARMRPAMEMIRKMTSELWNIEPTSIWPEMIADELVDEAVPFGSLLFYTKALQVLEEIPGIWEELKNKCEVLVDPVSRTVAEKMMDYLMPKVIEPAFRDFRDAAEDRSFEQLSAVISEEINKEHHMETIGRICESAAKTKADELKEIFQKVITDFLERLYGRKAEDANWDWSTEVRSDIDFSGIVTEAVRKAFINEITFGDFVVILLFGVFVIAIEIVEGAVKTVGKAWRALTWTKEARDAYAHQQKLQAAKQQAENKQKELAALRSKKDRIQIYKLATEDGETKQKTKEKLYKAIVEQLREECQKNGFGIPTAYLDCLADNIRKAVYTGL